MAAGKQKQSAVKRKDAAWVRQGCDMTVIRPSPNGHQDEYS
jgi:hypothetical protein